MGRCELLRPLRLAEAAVALAIELVEPGAQVGEAVAAVVEQESAHLRLVRRSLGGGLPSLKVILPCASAGTPGGVGKVRAEAMEPADGRALGR
jgi:hypothetical protein